MRIHAVFSAMSAYVSIRQQTAADVSIRQHTPAYAVLHIHAVFSAVSAYVSIRQHTSAYARRRCVLSCVCAPQLTNKLRPHTLVAQGLIHLYLKASTGRERESDRERERERERERREKGKKVRESASE